MSGGIRSMVGSGCISGAGGRGIGGHSTAIGMCCTVCGAAHAVSSMQSAQAVESDTVRCVSLCIDGLLSVDFGGGAGLRLPRFGLNARTKLGESRDLGGMICARCVSLRLHDPAPCGDAAEDGQGDGGDSPGRERAGEHAGDHISSPSTRGGIGTVCPASPCVQSLRNCICPSTTKL